MRGEKIKTTNLASKFQAGDEQPKIISSSRKKTKI